MTGTTNQNILVSCGLPAAGHWKSENPRFSGYTCLMTRESYHCAYDTTTTSSFLLNIAKHCSPVEVTKALWKEICMIWRAFRAWYRSNRLRWKPCIHISLLHFIQILDWSICEALQKSITVDNFFEILNSRKTLGWRILTDGYYVATVEREGKLVYSGATY